MFFTSVLLMLQLSWALLGRGGSWGVELDLVLFYFCFYSILSFFFILIYVFLVVVKSSADLVNVVYHVGHGGGSTMVGAVGYSSLVGIFVLL